MLTSNATILTMTEKCEKQCYTSLTDILGSQHQCMDWHWLWLPVVQLQSEEEIVSVETINKREISVNEKDNDEVSNTCTSIPKVNHIELILIPLEHQRSYTDEA